MIDRERIDRYKSTQEPFAGSPRVRSAHGPVRHLLQGADTPTGLEASLIRLRAVDAARRIDQCDAPRGGFRTEMRHARG